MRLFLALLISSVSFGALDLVSEVPRSQSQHIVVLSPSTDLVTSKSQVMVKGVNRYMTRVMVNGEVVELQPNGRYIETMPLSEDRYQDVIVSVILPSYEPINIQHKFIYLPGPADIDTVVVNRDQTLAFLNSDFVVDSHRMNPIQSGVTRAELAYFVAELTSAKLKKVSAPVYPDVEPSHWAAQEIQHAVNNQLMAEYADGTFRPDRGVSRLEYIMTVVRALELSLVYSKQALPFEDVDPNHWTTRFVFSALQHDIISPGKALRMNQPLTRLEFSRLAMKLPDVSTAVAAVLDFDHPYFNDKKRLAVYEDMVDEQIAMIKDEQEALRKLVVTSPSDNDVLFSSRIRVRGSIFPPGPIEVNGQTISSDSQGQFNGVISLKKTGYQKLKIKGMGREVERRVHYYPGYADLDRHWVGETAAKLKHLNRLEDTERFEPKTVFTRAEFSELIVKIMGWERDMRSADFGTDTGDYERYLIHRQVFSETNTNALVYRAEAIIAIARVAGFDPEIVYQMDGSVYQDVEGSHWARPYLAFLFRQNILSGARRFYPKRLISKAELVATLAKVPSVKIVLDELIADD